jgi:hypothetical protein
MSDNNNPARDVALRRKYRMDDPPKLNNPVVTAMMRGEERENTTPETTPPITVTHSPRPQPVAVTARRSALTPCSGATR